jgi:tRNA-specific 2-thiouridylase
VNHSRLSMGSARKGRVAVAMSGGLDSSMAAAILKEAGYEVIGLTMHLRDQAQNGSSGRCCPPEDIRDARRVADQIGIPHYVVNLRQAFEGEVVDYFVEEYLKGRTPNPCVRCNDRIKFGLLLRQAEELNAKALATGHYARIERKGVKKEGDPQRYLLRRGRDLIKDQSYFLFSLSQEQMGKIVFPLGEESKAKVRQQALRLGLRVAQKSESQEICFIPGDDYRKFVEMRSGEEISKPGEILNRQGKVLGFHRGLYGYTIGQRRGLGIAGPHPYYVLELDKAGNRVIAGTREELMAKGLVAAGVNWISFPQLEREVEARVQIRYRHPGAPAILSPLEGRRVRVDFRIPQRSVTPGQAAVFYQDEEVLGGGWIEKAL